MASPLELDGGILVSSGFQRLSTWPRYMSMRSDDFSELLKIVTNVMLPGAGGGKTFGLADPNASASTIQDANGFP